MEALVAIAFAALFWGAFSSRVVPWCRDQVPEYAVNVKHLDCLPAEGLETLIRLCCDRGSAWQTDRADSNQLFSSTLVPYGRLGPGAHHVVGQGMLDSHQGWKEMEIDTASASFRTCGPRLAWHLVVVAFPALMRLDHDCH